MHVTLLPAAPLCQADQRFRVLNRAAGSRLRTPAGMARAGAVMPGPAGFWFPLSDLALGGVRASCINGCMTRRPGLLIFPLLAAAAGCEPAVLDIEGLVDDIVDDLFSRQGTPGTQGRAKFAYTEGCALDPFSPSRCRLDGPVLVGGSAEVAVWGTNAQLPTVRAVSSDETVLRLGRTVAAENAEVQFSATGVAPGSATIELVTESGTVIDGISMEVAEAGRIAFAIPDRRRMILAGTLISLAVVVEDSAGQPAHGRGAIAFEMSGGIEPVGEYDPVFDRAFEGTDHSVYRAARVGVATVTAAIDRLAASETIEVVGEESIATIALSPERTQAEDGEAWIKATAADADGRRIYGLRCSWSVDGTADATLRVVAPNVFTDALFGDRDLIVVRAGQPGTADVTCTSGAVSATAMVRFP
jgi:hypothetical protein